MKDWSPEYKAWHERKIEALVKKFGNCIKNVSWKPQTGPRIEAFEREWESKNPAPETDYIVGSKASVDETPWIPKPSTISSNRKSGYYTELLRPKREAEVLKYFEDNGVDTEHQVFDLEALSKYENITEHNLHIWLCNLENTAVMEELVRGNWNAFDINQGSDFNDCYEDILEAYDRKRWPFQSDKKFTIGRVKLNLKID